MVIQPTSLEHEFFLYILRALCCWPYEKKEKENLQPVGSPLSGESSQSLTSLYIKATTTFVSRLTLRPSGFIRASASSPTLLGLSHIHITPSTSKMVGLTLSSVNQFFSGFLFTTSHFPYFRNLMRV